VESDLFKFIKWAFLVIVLAIVGIYVSLLRFDIPAAEVDALYTNAESEFMTLGNGQRVHYRDQGNPAGSILVLVHGSNASLHTWEPWVAELGDQFRIVSLDLQGHGLTGPAPDQDYTIPSMVRLVDEVVTRLGIYRFALAGSSMGGNTAWNYALSHPDRLNALILVGSGGYPQDRADNGGALVFRILSTEWGRKLLMNVDPTILARDGLETAFVDDSLVTDEMVDRYVTLAIREGSRDATSIRFSTPYATDMIPRIPEIITPTLIIQGDGDALVPADHARKFDEDIPNSTLIIYENVGHIPMEEIPAKTAADVRAFLNGVLGLEDKPEVEEPRERMPRSLLTNNLFVPQCSNFSVTEP
jgi:pimeloyl-ACP methyl ester carboxylesterase